MLKKQYCSAAAVLHLLCNIFFQSFIIDDDEQMLKILDNFHYYSLTEDIWDTVYFKKVN